MDLYAKKTQALSLPEEITREEILIRLPVKSLVRFQSVCKSWGSLLDDPDFMKAHVTRNMTQNPKHHADHLVALYSSTVRILSSSNQTLKQTGTRVFPLFFNYMLGCVNGLVCVSKIDRFFICNPAIGKIKDTYLAPCFYDQYKYDVYYARILGFGWDHVRNDFKIIACCLSNTKKKGAVYSSFSNSWTELVIPDLVFPRTIYDQKVIVLTPATIVKNCPYWRYTDYVIKFEVEMNEFRLLPELEHDTIDGKIIDFVNLKDCPAFMVYNETETVVTSVDLHSLDEVSGIWIKMYTIEPINFDVPGVQGLMGYLYGGEIVFDDQGKLFCYDPGNNVITSFLGCSRYFTADCFNYTPTLVYLPGMKKKVQYIDHFVSQ